MEYDIPQEHLNEIIRIAKIHGPKYVFGMHTKEDMVQEAIMMGMDAYGRWDKIRPLENFLCIHISNRLKTFKRDNFFRATGGNEKRQSFKRDLAEPSHLSPIENCYEHDFLGPIFNRENIELIEIKIPNHLRRNYLRLKHGAKLEFSKKQEIINCIKVILGIE